MVRVRVRVRVRVGKGWRRASGRTRARRWVWRRARGGLVDEGAASPLFAVSSVAAEAALSSSASNILMAWASSC